MNQNQYPQMLYKAPGAEQHHGGSFDTKIVADEAEHEAALADGWHETTPAATAAHEAVIAEKLKATAGSVSESQTGAPAGDDDAPPTRDELLAKAAELGIKHDPRLGDKKLAALIAEKLKA